MKRFSEYEQDFVAAQKELQKRLDANSDPLLDTQIELCIAELKNAALRMSACAYAAGERTKPVHSR